MKKNEKKNNSATVNQVVGAGVALGALAAAAAGAYFLYGSKNAKNNRAHVKSWVYKAKSEVLENLHKLQDISEKEYKKLVDAVLNNYQNVENITVQEVAQIAKDLKSQWKNIRNEIKKQTKGPKKPPSRNKKTPASKTKSGK